MESSTILAFRIFVMLSCLIIVPLAAIFGSAFPDVVKTVLVDRIVAWSTGQGVEAGGANPQPDGFRELAPAGTSVADAQRQGVGKAAPRWGGTESETASRGVVPLGSVGARGEFNQSASFSAPAAERTVYPPVHRVPASRDQPYPAEPEQRVLTTAGAPQESPAAQPGVPPQHADRFAELERKLREAGATYYLLETLGHNAYRFHCRMPTGNDPNLTRPFEATAADPLGAMSQVVEQVEAWRAGP